MSFATGSLVRARNREWVVLPESTDELVMVRPLGGSEYEVTGILAALESVEPATFDLPSPERLGDDRSARLLRDALRLGFRSSAGPFRSVAKIAVTPRPYQLVPLLMALKLDPVRLLIADDVGIGKTIESGLVAKELLEQGDAQRLCVLCPPHLAEQWQAELAEKFHIDAELVLSSTAARLERHLPVGRSVFDHYPFTVVSIDFIKSDRRRNDFVRACPELVIVDEAHTCADASEGAGARHQRYQLVADLASKPDRHLILVTATPHSGKEGSFRSLLSLLDPNFADLPDSLAGDANRQMREQLARHLVQRRRGDIRRYLETDTQFPDRLESEATYALSAAYRSVFNEVLDYARESVRTGDGHRQRVRWWSALGLLRALASSPAAAAATMRTRAATADAASEAEADEIGRQTVLDLDEAEEGVDVVPGAEHGEGDTAMGRTLRRLASLADGLAGDDDAKVVAATGHVRALLDEGLQPIVFCRFIETAEYVADQLKDRLPTKLGVEVRAVTGRIPPAEREARIEELGRHERRVLVATDCLSEGINLQDHFSAVLHYDLPWNPTRLEQREGRVDRFGQQAPEVRVITFYGSDNQIDETVLDVLLRKHVKIRNALGISVPVPGNTGEVIEALAETLLVRSDTSIEERLPGFDDYLRPATEQLHLSWEAAESRERQSRSIFAQHTIDPDEVAAELEALQQAVGSGASVERFIRTAVQAYGGAVAGDEAPVRLDLGDCPRALLDALGLGPDTKTLTAAFDLPVRDGVTYLARTHPLVAGLAGHVLDEALDPLLGGRAARAGVIETAAVERQTTLLLCRIRMNLTAESREGQTSLLAEEAALLAFSGTATSPTWLDADAAEALLTTRPSGNVSDAVAHERVREVLAAEAVWRPQLEAEAHRRAEELVAAHARVREAASRRGGTLARYRAAPQLPVDVLGVYVYLPELKL